MSLDFMDCYQNISKYEITRESAMPECQFDH